MELYRTKIAQTLLKICYKDGNRVTLTWLLFVDITGV
jgi:hypothetical protein